MSSISPAAARVPTDGRPLRLSRLGDELLARQATRGSSRAFTTLYERYHQPLYRYCRSIVRDDADAQDALQSTFTSALAALQRDARNAPLRPWLYRIAHNESVSLLRRRKRDGQHDAVTETTVIGASAEEEAAGRARWRRVVEDLAELPERQRGSLLLRELAGLSHEEIALTFGTTVGAAKQAIFEARQGLAELEEGRAMSCAEVRRRVSEADRRLLRGRRVSSHLKDCAACGAFAAAIPARQSDLRALTPALPPAVAAALLGRVLHSGASHAGAAAGSAASAAAVGKTAGTVIGWKALATVGVLAAGAAGVTGLTHAFHHGQSHPAHPAHPAAPAGTVSPTRPVRDHGAASAGVTPARSAAGRHTAKAGHGAAAARHRAAVAGGHGKHHRGASHNRGIRRHGSVHSGATLMVGLPVAASGPSSSASGHSNGSSAPGRARNRGVRRHGSASTTHASKTHQVSTTHHTASTTHHTASTTHHTATTTHHTPSTTHHTATTTHHTATTTHHTATGTHAPTVSPPSTVHTHSSTSTATSSGGSATGTVKKATKTSSSSSAPAPATATHAATGSASK